MEKIKEEIKKIRDSIFVLYDERDMINKLIESKNNRIIELEYSIKSHLVSEHLDNNIVVNQYIEIMSSDYQIVGKRNKIDKIRKRLGLSTDDILPLLKTKEGIESLKSKLIKLG